MDDVLASVKISDKRSLHIATLARETVVESGSEHLGFGGYFIFEACDMPGQKGISVLGKACSFEAALRLADIWSAGHVAA